MKDQEIINNLQISKNIFEDIPNELKPIWAGLILSQFDLYLENIPTEVKLLFKIIEEPSAWKKAHHQFTQIRILHNSTTEFKHDLYLHLAELVAKITYNASGESGPFDFDSGWYIPKFAFQIAKEYDDLIFHEEVKSIVLLFRQNAEFKTNLIAAKASILYKRIDSILWFNWDPIGVNDIAPRDEYKTYTSTIFDLKRAGADKESIAKHLFEIETKWMGLFGSLDRCLRIAELIVNLK
jgi:hypothetical protein